MVSSHIRTRTILQKPTRKQQFGILRNQILRLQAAFGLIPLVNPIDHAEQGQGRSARRDAALRALLFLHVGNHALDKVNVILLAHVDLLAQRRRQRVVLVKHYGDFAIAHTQHHLDVQTNEHAQALLRILDTTHRLDHALLGDIERMVHDVKQHLVLALEMVIQPALAELERGGYVVHGCRVVAPLLEQTGSRAQNVLAGIKSRFASHVRHGNKFGSALRASVLGIYRTRWFEMGVPSFTLRAWSCERPLWPHPNSRVPDPPQNQEPRAPTRALTSPDPALMITATDRPVGVQSSGFALLLL